MTTARSKKAAADPVTEQIPTDVLTLDPANANRGTERGRPAVTQSLEECGAGRSILADRNGTVIAGNKTLEAARKLGLSVRVVETAGDELLVVKRTDLSLGEGDRARRLAYLDNRSSELGLEWDLEQLLRDLEAGFDLTGCGFEEAELAALLRSLEPVGGLTDPDDVPEPPEEPISKLGDLWQLGNHRLLCGDSTNPADVARLMNGERAVLFATDPPYAVGYDGTNHPTNGRSRPSKNKDWSDSYQDWDKLGASAAEALYDGFCQVARDVAIADDAAWYCWHASVNVRLVFGAWEKAGAFVHQQIIWVKSRPILGRSWYMWQHEPCLFGWVSPHKPNRTADDSPRSVWEIESFSQQEKPDHPTPKPVEVFKIPMRQHTVPGDICYEPFSGSGSQQIAGEELGRRVYGLEREPRYVDVAVTRWQNFTGKVAKRVEV